MKRGTPRHPKMRELAKALRIPLPYAVGLTEMLWHFTAEHAPQGDIGRWSDEAIAQGSGWVGVPSRLVEAWVRVGWLDPSPTHRLVTHDWHDHADQGTRKWLERKGLKFLSLPEIVSGQCPDSVRTESIQVRTVSGQCPPSRARASLEGSRVEEIPPIPPNPDAATPLVLTPPVPSNGTGRKATKKKNLTVDELTKKLGQRVSWWIEFWGIYPCKFGKVECMRAFEECVDTDKLWREVRSGAIHYAARIHADPTQGVKYGQGWLHASRWIGENEAAQAAELPPVLRKLMV